MAEQIRIRAGGLSRTFTAPGPVVLGRSSAEAAVVIGHRAVSGLHAKLVHDGHTWLLSDLGSTNGTWVDGGAITASTPIGSAVTVRLGKADDGADVILEPLGESSRQGAPTQVMPPPPTPMPPQAAMPSPGVSELHSMVQGALTVGRDPSNTVVLDDLLVSRHHAELRFDGQTWWLQDFGSSNGTYVDGRRIERAPVTPQSLIGIGHQTFRLRGSTLEQYRDTGAVTFEARDLVVLVGARRLLDQVSFVLEPNSMLVIIGPSGSGKSTLLKALTGTGPATSGQVGYGGRDLYSNYDEIRHRIGFVPQDDILHPQLRVREALDFAGRLRFPQDVAAAQRVHRVREVIAELGLDQQAEQRISSLSGGQRKRTSTAMELLTRPSLLFLDEPTSGLDINRDREVMHRLRDLADAGRTVVVVSHNVAYLNLADRILILATGGQVAYYGPAGQMLDFFGAADYADMYAALEAPRSDWRERFERSPIPKLRPPTSRPPLTGRSNGPPDVMPMRQQPATSQFVTLCRRYLAVIAADRQFVALMVAMPLVLALFAHAVPGKAGLSVAATRTAVGRAQFSQSPLQLLLVLVLGGCLVGSAASVREIVKERPIFQRERAIGLSWQAYLASKAMVLAVVAGVQAILLTLLGAAGHPGPDRGVLTSAGTPELMLALVLVTIASMALGLILSALVKNADRAMPLLVLVIMAQLLMSGGLFPVRHRPVLEQLSWLSPARWGYAAGASILDVGSVPGRSLDPLWKHDTGTFLGDLAILVLLTAVYLAVTAGLLRRVGRVRAPRP